jgi:hypothetical protein
MSESEEVTKQDGEEEEEGLIFVVTNEDFSLTSEGYSNYEEALEYAKREAEDQNECFEIYRKVAEIKPKTELIVQEC